MDVRNCKKCGKLFQYSGEAICPACAKEMEQKFMSVKSYIYDNPTASVKQVAEENDVPIQQIKKWVRQERLSFSKDSGISIDCEKCGKPILTGRFCKECKATMSDSFSKMYEKKGSLNVKKDKKTDARMRFINNDD
ncbi:MAG: flagellar protein [Lachnospiraceae bacterium]|nr:flagellar protein [Lachnospiraceae bacterium]MCI5586545.1 flagellar protein [Lachnospiraceae bacterium]